MTGWRYVRERARLADTALAALAVLLASACLFPLMTDLRWVPSVLVMVLVISSLGAVSRGLGMPVPFVPVIEAVGLMLTTTALFAGEQAWGRLMPTTQAWDALGALLRDGVLQSQTYSAPVEPSAGVILLVVGGVGLVALATDTLFVSVRAPVLAGLPLMALYLVPALILAGGPWWLFVMPATGWLIILAADQREQIRSWGGLPGTTRIRGLSTGARRVGAIAVLVATGVGVVLPISPISPWRSATGEGPGDGSSGGTSQEGGDVILDPLVSMRRSLVQSNDTEVLTYRTRAPNPSYLRISALETFDGITWRPREGLASGRDLGTPVPGDVLTDRVAADPNNRVTNGESYAYDITVTNLQNSYLPLPYPIADVEDVSGLDANWRVDPSTGIAFSDGVPASGLAYRVAALDPGIQAAQLRDASAPSGGFWPQLNLPGGLPPQIADLAAEVTADAETPYDKAVALQQWFTRDGGFQYSTSVPSGSDAEYLAEFVTDRIGYCEQFASTMAVMARTLGIPSRVVVGFTQGRQLDDGSWQVRARDAHAWPELWFDGVGWARFEPTPGGSANVSTPSYAGDQVPQEALLNRRLIDTEELPAAAPSRGVSAVAVGGALVAGILTVLALAWLLAPMLRRRVRRYRRLHARGDVRGVEGAWAEIADLAIDLGQPWSDAATPRQAADRLARGMSEEPAAALKRVRQEVERVRYAQADSSGAAGGSDAAREHVEAVRADARTVMRELRARVRFGTRLRAYCWPPSERRRQRSSMRSMKLEDGAALGGVGLVGASASSAAREPKAE